MVGSLLNRNYRVISVTGQEGFIGIARLIGSNNNVAFGSEEPSVSRFSMALSKNILHMDNEAVLSKAVAATTLEDALVEAFPAIRQSDYYFDFQSSEQNIISIVRKKVLDDFLSLLPPEQKLFSSIRIGKSFQSIDTNKRKTSDLKENSELLTASEVAGLPYASNVSSLEKEHRSLWLNERLFQFLKWFSLAFFLVALTVNFMIGEGLRTEVMELELLESGNRQLTEKVDALRRENASISQMLEASNHSDRSRIRLINEIILATGRDIRLEQLVYQELESQLEPNRQAMVDSNKVRIVGRSIGRNSFEPFVEKVGNISQVSDVDVIKAEESANGIEFELLISLDETAD